MQKMVTHMRRRAEQGPDENVSPAGGGERSNHRLSLTDDLAG